MIGLVQSLHFPSLSNVEIPASTPVRQDSEAFSKEANVFMPLNLYTTTTGGTHFT